MALRQHVEFLILRQELHIDALAHRLPGQRDEVILQLGQPPLGGADQIGNWRIGRAHLGQHLLGWDAAVHHPDTVALPYWASILSSMSRKVVQSAVLPASTS